MRKERKHFTPRGKSSHLRRHLLDKVPVSKLCEELGLRPTVFYRWQKELFENGAAAFQSQERPHRFEDFDRSACPASPADFTCVQAGQILDVELSENGMGSMLANASSLRRTRVIRPSRALSPAWTAQHNSTWWCSTKSRREAESTKVA